ncbi:MAG: peptidoglycan-binding domain-containing protein [Promethearchaeota archaeon]
MGSKKMKKMEKIKERMEAMGGFAMQGAKGMGGFGMPGVKGIGGFGMPGAKGMGGFGMLGSTSLSNYIDESHLSELSRHIAARQVKRGISKGVEIVRLKNDIELTNPIGSPENLEQPLNKEELRLVAQRLYDLGYYYINVSEDDDIEFTLAPTYMGLIGKASSEERNSLQAAIKRFQRVHGFSPEKCDGFIEPGDKTLEKLNSNLRTSLVSHGTGPIFMFEDKSEQDHLHPILNDFMEDVEWSFKRGVSFRQDIKRGRKKSVEEKIMISNTPREIVISHASFGYPGDGHRNLDSKHYKAQAIDVISVNGVSVSDSPRELALPPSIIAQVSPPLRQWALAGYPGGTVKVLAFFIGPVVAFAHFIEAFKEIENKIHSKWSITELDSPWHGDKENHQDHIHIGISRKTHIGSD